MAAPSPSHPAWDPDLKDPPFGQHGSSLPILLAVVGSAAYWVLTVGLLGVTQYHSNPGPAPQLVRVAAAAPAPAPAVEHLPPAPVAIAILEDEGEAPADELPVPDAGGRALALADVEAPARNEPAECGKRGTSIPFVSNPADAFRKAARERKLVFVVHLSGHFEDEEFT
jgi:hypothetical protein